MTGETEPIRTFNPIGVQLLNDLLLRRKMNKRTELHAADLYVLLQREFRRRQAQECKACFVQLPYRVDRREDDAANWEIALPIGDCTFGCRQLVEELVEEFRALYDLSTEAANHH